MSSLFWSSCATSMHFVSFMYYTLASSPWRWLGCRHRRLSTKCLNAHWLQVRHDYVIASLTMLFSSFLVRFPTLEVGVEEELGEAPARRAGALGAAVSLSSSATTVRINCQGFFLFLFLIFLFLFLLFFLNRKVFLDCFSFSLSSRSIKMVFYFYCELPQYFF